MLEIVESDKFQDNFTMALCSFGGVNDQCGTSSWAVHETGMIPLLSCDKDMTAWSKDKYKAVRCVRARGRPGGTKAAGDSKDQIGIIHVHK